VNFDGGGRGVINRGSPPLRHLHPVAPPRRDGRSYLGVQCASDQRE
jgi:hypothetical protein